MDSSIWERKVMIAGIAWMIAGTLALLVGIYIAAPAICNCPEIPSNATPAQIAKICPCGTSISGFIYIGVVALIAGLCIVLFRRRIAEYAVKMLQKSTMTKQ